MHNPVKNKIKWCLYKPIIKKKRKIMPTVGIKPGYQKTFGYAISDSGKTN